jgi:DNA-binding transcriptional ArsR family regulator
MVSGLPLDRVFHALAHPARRSMLRRLATGERNLSELAAPLRMTFPAASKHVRVLEAARLVRRRVRGRDHVCRIVVRPLDQVARWAEECRALWESTFARLDALLEELKAGDASSQAPISPALPVPASRLPRRSRRAAR